MSTLIVYLNDVVEGGATAFPEIGLSVTPRRGHAVYFEYANSRQQLDGKSLHAGAPVIRGEKWAMTKWMRTRRFVLA
jgi:prolyl 4-hydroxylase